MSSQGACLNYRKTKRRHKPKKRRDKVKVYWEFFFLYIGKVSGNKWVFKESLMKERQEKG